MRATVRCNPWRDRPAGDYQVMVTEGADVVLVYDGETFTSVHDMTAFEMQAIYEVLLVKRKRTKHKSQEETLFGK